MHHHALDALDLQLIAQMREEHRLIGHLLDDAGFRWRDWLMIATKTGARFM